MGNCCRLLCGKYQPLESNINFPDAMYTHFPKELHCGVRDPALTKIENDIIKYMLAHPSI